MKDQEIKNHLAIAHILLIKMYHQGQEVYTKKAFLSHQNLSIHNKINWMKWANLLSKVQLNLFSEIPQMKRSIKTRKINRIKSSKR